MTQPSVGIVVLTWNNAKDIRDCLQSLGVQNYSNYKVIVVDNASRDKTASIVRSEFPEVKLIVLEKNLFFTGGNNLGIDYAQKKLNSEFIAILNPDTIVEPNWISSQVQLMQSNPKFGIIGPKVVFAENFGTDGKLSTESQKIINTVGIVPGGFLFPYDRGFGEPDQGQYESTEEIYAVSGVSMFMRAEMLHQIGGFFTPMQMYLEDVDLCLRARKADWKVIYTSDTTLQHKHMQSTVQSGANRHFYWSRRNYLILVSRNYPFKKFLRALWQLFRETSFKDFVSIVISFLLIKLKY